MVRIASALVLSVLVILPAAAGEFNKKLSVGDAAPTFSNLPGTDDKDHSLSDFKKDVVVIIITCNKCPVAVAYEDRIVELSKKYKDKADIVAINVNTEEEDRLPKMKERASEKGFSFPYLYDESQNIGRQLGASVTPECFVLDKNRKVVYMGALDNNMDYRKATVNYVGAAIEATLKGEKPAKAETKAMGCGVAYTKK
jgi:peroxiredoxin